jgi:hypothetical protein
VQKSWQQSPRTFAGAAVRQLIMATGVVHPDRDLPLDGPVYCSGGCCRPRQLLAGVAGEAFRPSFIVKQRLITQHRIGWAVERKRTRIMSVVALHCDRGDCQQAVRVIFQVWAAIIPTCLKTAASTFQSLSKEARADNPELNFRRNCALCNKVDSAAVAFKRCARCKVPAYCSTACATADWPHHREGCTGPT